MGQDQHLCQVSSNSGKNLAVLHSFIKAMFIFLLYKLVVVIYLSNLPLKFLGLDYRLGQVSSTSENVRNFIVLHGFIESSSFPFYTNLQLLLRFANLPHKFLGLDQRFGQVSSNSEKVQNLADLHGFIKASLFRFYIDL